MLVGDRLLVFPTRKILALLIYLAVEGGQHPREHLATMLWPESNTERSHASLRNTLGHLQSALRQASNQTDNAYLSVTHTALALNLDAPINLDLSTVGRGYRLARAERSSQTPPDGAASLPLLMAAADAYRGDFLLGFSLSDASDFDDWASNQREVWRRRLSLIVDRLSEIQFARGDFAGTADTGSRWIALDVLNEAAYRRKMRAHFAAGERGQALATFELCHTILNSELDVEPEPDIRALVERIRTQHSLQRVTPQPQIDTPIAFLESLFAGRRTEHQVLVDHYERVVTGQPQIAILQGEAGIGKSRLSREFLRRIGEQGAQLIQGRAFESGSLTLYQPLVEAIRPLFERDSTLLT
jgi:DNA-binding SARP family transcriptional activator